MNIDAKLNINSSMIDGNIYIYTWGVSDRRWWKSEESFLTFDEIGNECRDIFVMVDKFIGRISSIFFCTDMF